MRSKGFFWLATRPSFAGSWSQAGGVARQHKAGMWWASVPRERWPEDPETLQFILEYWIEGIGDARQELVFIGIDMDEAGLRRDLDNCLLNDLEMLEGPIAWEKYHDPLHAWDEA